MNDLDVPYPGPATGLSSGQWRLYNLLRYWRALSAWCKHCPAYLVASDRRLRDLAGRTDGADPSAVAWHFIATRKV